MPSASIRRPLRGVGRKLGTVLRYPIRRALAVRTRQNLLVRIRGCEEALGGRGLRNAPRAHGCAALPCAEFNFDAVRLLAEPCLLRSG